MEKKLGEVLHLFEDSDKRFIKKAGFSLDNKVIDNIYQEYQNNNYILKVTFEKGFTGIKDIDLWSPEIQTELDRIGY